MITWIPNRNLKYGMSKIEVLFPPSPQKPASLQSSPFHKWHFHCFKCSGQRLWDPTDSSLFLTLRNWCQLILSRLPLKYNQNASFLFHCYQPGPDHYHFLSEFLKYAFLFLLMSPTFVFSQYSSHGDEIKSGFVTLLLKTSQLFPISQN